MMLATLKHSLRSNGSKLLASRNLSILNALEEFPGVPSLQSDGVRSSGSASVQESVLKNGIRVVSYDRTGNAGISSLKISIASGSQSETIRQKGAAHLSTVNTFNGTSSVSGLRLARNLENLGAKVNAYSNRDEIVYEIKALPDKIDQAFDLLVGTIKKPLKPTFVVKEAKSRVEHIYANFASDPKAQLAELLHEASFGELTPLGGSVYAESLDKLDELQVLQFATENLDTEKIVVAASGVSHDKVKQLVEAAFNNFVHIPSPKVAPSPFTGGEVRIRKDLDGASYVALGLPASPASYQANKALVQLLQKLLPQYEVVYNHHVLGGLIGFYYSGDAVGSQRFVADSVAAVKALSQSAAGASFDAVKTKNLLEHKLSFDGDATRALLNATVLKAGDAKSLESLTAQDVSAAAARAYAGGAHPGYVVLGKTFGTHVYSAVVNLFK